MASRHHHGDRDDDADLRRVRSAPHYPLAADPARRVFPVVQVHTERVGRERHADVAGFAPVIPTTAAAQAAWGDAGRIRKSAAHPAVDAAQLGTAACCPTRWLASS